MSWTPRPRLLQGRALGPWLLLCVLGANASAAGTSTDASLHAALTAERQRAPAVRHARGDFLQPEVLPQVLMSPDGAHIAYLQQLGGHGSVWVMGANGEAARALLTQSDATQLYWSSDSQWLFAQSSTRLLALSVSGAEGSGLMASLPPGARTEVFAADPVQPALLLIERPSGTGQAGMHQLWRIDRLGQRTLLYQHTQPLVDFAFVGDGRLAYIKRYAGAYFAIVALAADGAEHEVARCAALRRCTLVGVAADGALLLLGNLGSDRVELQRINTEGQVSRLHSDPRAQADLRELSIDPQTLQPVLAHYRSTQPHSEVIDPRLQPLWQRLRADFGDSRWQLSISRGPDPCFLIGVSNSRTQRTRWWHLDSTQAAEKPLLQALQAPNWPITEAVAATKIAVSWAASDGFRLHGFVSVPPGMDPAQLPLVVKVHGGPWTHVGPEYSETTQFLVNRGYAVFEPNFRGSTGYGREYLLAAKGDFGNGRVQQDIIDGTRWLLDQGVGDSDRVAIVGASFGGYAALLGVSYHPELYRVAIAAVPPTDFGWTLRWAVEHQVLALESVAPFAQSLRALDLGLDNTALLTRLSAQSPLAQAATLSRPVVLFAAGQDERVAIRSINHYAARLVELGKDVDLYVQPESGHALDDALAREAFLFLLEDTLHRELSGPEATPPAAPLRDYLDRVQRIERGKIR
jgi:dipeptidyl aminopeptidase/acylaminoacyl peptidase